MWVSLQHRPWRSVQSAQNEVLSPRCRCWGVCRDQWQLADPKAVPSSKGSWNRTLLPSFNQMWHVGVLTFSSSRRRKVSERLDIQNVCPICFLLQVGEYEPLTWCNSSENTNHSHDATAQNTNHSHDAIAQRIQKQFTWCNSSEYKPFTWSNSSKHVYHLHDATAQNTNYTHDATGQKIYSIHMMQQLKKYKPLTRWYSQLRIQTIHRIKSSGIEFENEVKGFTCWRS